MVNQSLREIMLNTRYFGGPYCIASHQSVILSEAIALVTAGYISVSTDPQIQAITVGNNETLEIFSFLVSVMNSVSERSVPLCGKIKGSSKDTLKMKTASVDACRGKTSRT